MPLKSELEEHLADANRHIAVLTAQLQSQTALAATLSDVRGRLASAQSDAAQLRERGKSLAAASVAPDLFLAVDPFDTNGSASWNHFGGQRVGETSGACCGDQ